MSVTIGFKCDKCGQTIYPRGEYERINFALMKEIYVICPFCKNEIVTAEEDKRDLNDPKRPFWRSMT